MALEAHLFISNFATLTDTKIALWRNLLSIQNEANWLAAMLSKCQLNLNRASLVLEDTIALKAKSTNLIHYAAKNQVTFCHQRDCVSQKTPGIAWIFQGLKKTLWKPAVAVDIETLEDVWFELWMRGTLVMVEICLLCGRWFSSAFEMVSETFSSCDTDSREL